MLGEIRSFEYSTKHSGRNIPLSIGRETLKLKTTMRANNYFRIFVVARVADSRGTRVFFSTTLFAVMSKKYKSKYTKTRHNGREARWKRVGEIRSNCRFVTWIWFCNLTSNLVISFICYASERLVRDPGRYGVASRSDSTRRNKWQVSNNTTLRKSGLYPCFVATVRSSFRYNSNVFLIGANNGGIY